MDNIDFCVYPEVSLMCDDLSIKAWGLCSNEIVTITASVINPVTEVLHTSSYNVQASTDGTIDLSRDPSIFNDFTIVDPMAFMWNLEPIRYSNDYYKSLLNLNKPLKLTFSLSCKKGSYEKNVFRKFISDEIIIKNLNDDGIIGKLFYNKDNIKRTTVIVNTDSENGDNFNFSFASLLSSIGYTVLSFSSKLCHKYKKSNYTTPIEKFKGILDLIYKEPSVDKDKIGLLGLSDGCEYSFHVASRFKEIKFVISYSPRTYSFQKNISHNASPPWSYNGEILPYIKLSKLIYLKEYFMKLFNKNSISFKHIIMYSLLNCRDKEASMIEVEKINGPILLFSGDKDAVWSSNFFCKECIKRLKKCNFNFPVYHFNYKDAGHIFSIPYTHSYFISKYKKIGSLSQKSGGTLNGFITAQNAAWKETLKFLSKL